MKNSSLIKSNGKKKAPHKDSEVASGVKKALMRMFPTHLHKEVKEEFANFVAGLDDYSDISASEEKRHETEKLLREGMKTYQISLYSGVEHGFAVRADMSRKEVKYAKEAAFLQQVQWFDEWLK